MRRQWPVSAPAGLPMVLLRVAVLTLPACQCLVRVRSAEQAQCRQAARVAQLAWWFRLVRSQLERSAGPTRFVAQFELGSAIEREVCRRNGRQRLVPVARSGVPPVSVRVMWLRVSAAPEGGTWGVPARKTARVVKALRMTAIVMNGLRMAGTLVKAAQAMLTLGMPTLATPIRKSAAPTLVPPEVSPSRVVARPAQSKAPLSACRAGP